MKYLCNKSLCLFSYRNFCFRCHVLYHSVFSAAPVILYWSILQHNNRRTKIIETILDCEARDREPLCKTLSRMFHRNTGKHGSQWTRQNNLIIKILSYWGVSEIRAKPPHVSFSSWIASNFTCTAFLCSWFWVSANARRRNIYLQRFGLLT